MEYKFKTKPYEHQANALKKIFRSELGHALFMDPGTGKTKIAIDSVASFHQDKKVKKVLKKHLKVLGGLKNIQKDQK